MATTASDGSRTSSTISHTSQTFSLGGMGAPFTPPSTCLGNTYTLAPNGYDETTTTSYAGRTATSTIASRGLDPSCFYNVTAIPTTPAPTAAVLHYSPGTCFIGYSAVALSVSGGFTTATCCPSGLLIGPSGTQCRAGLAPGASVDSRTSAHIITPTQASITVVDGTTTKPVVASSRVAPALVVTWYTAEAGLWNTSVPTSLYSPSGESNNHGREVGLGVGLGVGIPLLICLGAITYWMLRRRRRKNVQAVQPVEEPLAGKAELHSESKKIPELPEDATLHEAGGFAKPPEADNANMRAELESDWRGWEAPVNSRDP